MGTLARRCEPSSQVSRLLHARMVAARVITGQLTAASGYRIRGPSAWKATSIGKIGPTASQRARCAHLESCICVHRGPHAASLVMTCGSSPASSSRTRRPSTLPFTASRRRWAFVNFRDSRSRGSNSTHGCCRREHQPVLLINEHAIGYDEVERSCRDDGLTITQQGLDESPLVGPGPRSGEAPAMLVSRLSYTSGSSRVRTTLLHSWAKRTGAPS
jgi:hypothetical protein